jgi:hypothetical protein
MHWISFSLTLPLQSEIQWNSSNKLNDYNNDVNNKIYIYVFVLVVGEVCIKISFKPQRSDTLQDVPESTDSQTF